MNVSFDRTYECLPDVNKLVNPCKRRVKLCKVPECLNRMPAFSEILQPRKRPASVSYVDSRVSSRKFFRVADIEWKRGVEWNHA